MFRRKRYAKYEIDFSNDDLSRNVGQRMKDQLAEKLRSAGLADRIKLTFRENGHGVPVDFDIEGAPDEQRAALRSAPEMATTLSMRATRHRPLSLILVSLDGMTRPLALCLMILLAACRSEAPPQTKMMTLPSGKSVRVYSIQRITFGDNSHPPSLLLRYETLRPPRDSPELREEVRDVWELLRPMADEAGDTYAMVKANEPIRGTVAKTEAFTYGFIKAEDGTWKMREPKSN